MFGVSIYLAKVIGLNMAIIGLLLLLKPKAMKEATGEIINHPGLTLLYGLLTLILGSVLINLHNLWVMAWNVVITVIAWIVFFRGFTRLFFPATVKNFTQRFSHHYTFMVAGVVAITVGLFLMYHGFYVPSQY